MFKIDGNMISYDGETVAMFRGDIPPTVRARVEDVLNEWEEPKDPYENGDASEEVEAERARAVKFGCDIDRQMITIRKATQGGDVAEIFAAIYGAQSTISEYMETATGERVDNATLAYELESVKKQRDAYAAILGIAS